jgi:hypothetical protein
LGSAGARNASRIRHAGERVAVHDDPPPAADGAGRVVRRLEGDEQVGLAADGRLLAGLDLPPDVGGAAVHPGEAAAALGVLGEARPEVAGLADVEQLALGGEEEVDARRRRRQG